MYTCIKTNEQVERGKTEKRKKPICVWSKKYDTPGVPILLHFSRETDFSERWNVVLFLPAIYIEVSFAG